VAQLAGLAALLGLLVLVRYQNVVFGVLPAALWARLAGRGQWPTFAAAARAAAVAVLAYLAPLGIEVAHLAGTGELAWVRPRAWLGGGRVGPAPAGAGGAVAVAGLGLAGAGAGPQGGGGGAAAPGAPPGGTVAGLPAPGGVVLAQNRFDLRSPHF